MWAAHLLLWPKFLYFMLNFCVYATYIYYPRYVKDCYGITDSSFGLLNSLTAVCFFASIGWTSLADRTRQHTAIVAVSASMYAFFVCSLWLAQGFFAHAEQLKRELFVAFCFLSCNIFISALYPILDSRIMVMLSQHKDQKNFSKDLYGRQRLWGCLGQSAVTLVTGYAIQTFGYPGMFVVMSLSTAIFIVAFIAFQCTQFAKGPCAETVEETCGQEKKDQNADSGPKTDSRTGTGQSPFLRLLSHPQFLLFLYLVLIGGVIRGIVGNYLQQFLERYYDVQLLEFAYLTLARLITEISAFFIGQPLLSRFGPQTLLIAGIVCGMIRIGSYGFMPLRSECKAYVPLIELFKGLNAAFMAVGGTRIAHDIAPAGAEATAQGFFSGMHGNLSNAFSGLFGGVVIELFEHDYYALRRLFQVSTCLAMASTILYSVHVCRKS